MKKFNLKLVNGITLISLVITIIVLLILAGVTLKIVLGDSGIFSKAQIAKEETNKNQATEVINLKITNVQIDTYAKTQTMPTLQNLADAFCDDNDIQYVKLPAKETASLEKVTVGTSNSIFTKLKDYPYEFEINSSLQLASIDGVKISTVPSNDDDTIVSMTKAELKSLIASEVSSQLTNNSSLNTTVLWSGRQYSGTISLSETTSEYDYLLIYVSGDGSSTSINLVEAPKTISDSKYAITVSQFNNTSYYVNVRFGLLDSELKTITIGDYTNAGYASYGITKIVGVKL